MKKIIYRTSFFRKFYVLVAFFLFANIVVLAQCPATTANATNIISANCPSNGAFTISATPSTGVKYQITSGPDGFPTGAQDLSTFSSLLPGTYTVNVICASNSSILTTINNIVVPGTYVQIAASSVVTNLCNGTSSGIINTTVTAGNSAPYSYAYWIGDPALDDNSLTYQVVNSGSTTNAFNAPSFGIWNIRVKDACGKYVTDQQVVANPYPAGLCVTNIDLEFDTLTCAQLQDSIFANFQLGSTPFAALPPAGIDLDIFENTGTCASPVQGPLVRTYHYDNNSGSTKIKIPNKKNLLFVVRTPCGTSCTYCYTYDPDKTRFLQNVFMLSKGCVNPGDPITYSISVGVNLFYRFPITWVIKNSAGVIKGTFTANNLTEVPHTFDGLPADTYTTTATDACGNTITDILAPPSGPPNELQVVYSGENVGCTSIDGKSSITVYIQGVMANLSNATAVIIAPSPDHVGVAGTQAGFGYFSWMNITPGATYYIRVDNGCGQSDTVTVTAGTFPQNILTQHTIGSVKQFCGGTGSIAIDAAYNGYGNFSYKVTNSAGSIVALGSVPGGTYDNLPAGIYTIKTSVYGCGPYDYSSQVEILSAGSGPSVIKKIGVICENPDGTPATTGSAIFSFIGAKPLKFDYRLSSGTDADYLNVTNASDGTETVPNLSPNTSYTVRITDSCGNSTITQVSIGQLSPVKTENTLNPCPFSPYTLSVPDFVDATYEWKKGTTVISNQRSIIFNPYTPGDDGVYTCKIVISGCVTRTVTTTLSSASCNIPLPVTILNFTAKNQDGKVMLNWKTATEINSAYFDVQYSVNAVNWQSIGNVTAAGNSNSVKSYSFIHTNPSGKVNYYRLKLVDTDNSFKYSDIRVVNLDKNATVSLFPNPVTETLYITGNASLLTKVSILAMDGKTLKEYKMLAPGSGIDMKNFSSGMYIIKILDVDGNSTTQKVIKK